jgi:Domain of Unknown Function (DUF1080)
MSENGPALPSDRAPKQGVNTGNGTEKTGMATGSRSLISKIGTGVFGTLIAPLIVAMILKSYEFRTTPVAQPVIGQVEPKRDGASSVPNSLTPGPSVGASRGDSKPELASIRAKEPSNREKSGTAADDPNRSHASTGFKPLFNGRDLSGWIGADHRWSVNLQNQSLAGHDLTGAKGNQRSWLFTEQEFSDFRLRLEYQAAPHSDSGIILRLPTGVRVDEGYKIQIGDDQENAISTGTIVGLRVGQGHPHTRPTMVASLRTPGDWNLLEIELRGPRLQMTINGQIVQDARFDKQPESSKSNKKALGASGRIGLQSRIGQVEFRHIEIQDLTTLAR